MLMAANIPRTEGVYDTRVLFGIFADSNFGMCILLLVKLRTWFFQSENAVTRSRGAI